MKISFSLMFVILAIIGNAQDDWRQDLVFYADAMVNASDERNRVRAEAEFRRLMHQCLSGSASDSLSFSDLPWVTVISPADSTFRVITWQLRKAKDFEYAGYIQFRDKTIPLIELEDTRSLNSEYSSFTPDTWYGALYYGIQAFRTEDKHDAYVLLGFNAHTPSLNQRVADVLSFSDGKVIFGAPVFVESDTVETRSRIILEYADAAAGTMRFDRELELLIYDHVIPVSTPEGPTRVPDGSYHGYNYKKGKWLFVDSVFNVKVDEPPGGRPKESVDRDLFGRPVGKKD